MLVGRNFGKTKKPTSRDDSIPTEDFLHKSVSVWERVPVGEGGKAIRTNYGIDFSLSLLLHIRETGHSQEKRIDRRHRLREQVSVKL